MGTKLESMAYELVSLAWLSSADICLFCCVRVYCFKNVVYH